MFDQRKDQLSALPGLPLLAGVAASSILLIILLFPHSGGTGTGPFTHHMIVHIALMNLLAPAVANIIRGYLTSAGIAGARILLAAAATQITLFYAWHSPPLIDSAMQSMAVMLAMQVTLFAAALFFWLSVLSQPPAARWRSVCALLITGKLFCLMAVLLIFAPRILYGGDLSATQIIDLADQQMAGLIMAVVCPLAYVATATVIIARWLLDLPQADGFPE